MYRCFSYLCHSTTILANEKLISEIRQYDYRVSVKYGSSTVPNRRLPHAPHTILNKHPNFNEKNIKFIALKIPKQCRIHVKYNNKILIIKKGSNILIIRVSCHLQE